MTNSGTAISELNDLLDAERVALLEGDLEKVTDLLPPKEVLIGEMNGASQADLAAMQVLDRKVKRNQLLLNGALDGIRTVADRMQALRRVRNSLETYGADGKKRAISVQTRSSVEKRA